MNMQIPQKQSSGNAIASLVLGIAGLVVFPLVPSILAVIFGNISKKENEPQAGMATAGVVLGWIGIGVSVLIFCAAIAIGLFVYFSAPKPVPLPPRPFGP